MAQKIVTPHQILGVPTSATVEQITAAYRKLAKKCHPDVCKDADAAERFKRLNTAKESAIERAELFTAARKHVDFSWAQTGTDSIFMHGVVITVRFPG